MGRPSLYSPELADHICELIATGTPVYRIPEISEMPAESTIYLWMEQHKEFSEKYARAKARLADRMVEEVVTIADEADPTTMKGIEHARTRMDARKWAAGKLSPKKYGERIKQEISGPNDGPVEVSDARDRLRNLLARKRVAPDG
ncbi:MAG: hypothetical protein KGO96_13535 [Elusimicrobia bacterium]|nr:hypothetical protein [Elusimicrobiota bacterium]